MPQAMNLAQQALNLWLAMATTLAELHVRTEMPTLIEALTFGRPVETIPFDPMAANISSHHTSMSKQSKQEIIERGFRLVE